MTTTLSLAPARPTQASAATMRAARVHQFGGPDVISLDTIDRPEPGMDEVLVRVKAAGVGPWDGWIRGGRSGFCQRSCRRV